VAGRRKHLIVAALCASFAAAAIAAFLVISGVVSFAPRRIDPAAYEFAGASWRTIRFEDIEGWRADNTADTIEPFLRSCARIASFSLDAPVNASEALGPEAPAGASLSGAAADWREACAGARRFSTQRFIDDKVRHSAARAFYEAHFTPVMLADIMRRKNPILAFGEARRVEQGLFTAYFEPFYAAAGAKVGAFTAPVLARPDDLVSIDLGAFRDELAGQRIAGRVEAGALVPYPDHAAIAAGGLNDKARPLAYMRPNDLLFLQIQGSGRLRLDNRTVRIAYDGQNGHAYTPIGRVLIAEGQIARDKVSMQTIMAWLDRASPQEAARVRHANRSYVFFRMTEDEGDPALGPVGAAGAPLTPGRSLAVDPRFVAFGAPVFVSLGAGAGPDRAKPFQRLLIAQDIGGAIKGAARGDVFTGSGSEAGETAGAFNERGAMALLVPNSVAARLPRAARP
jgi:membrane-bound lytic murein transglycosylase A